MMVKRPEGAIAAELTFLEGLMQSIESNLLTEDRYLLLWDGLKTTFVIPSSPPSSAPSSAASSASCACRVRSSSTFGQDLHLRPARHSRGRAADADLLRGLRLGEHQPGAGGGRRIRPHFAAYVAEIFRTGVEGIETGQTEAGLAMGFSRTQTFRIVILPQMIRRILPVYKASSSRSSR